MAHRSGQGAAGLSPCLAESGTDHVTAPGVRGPTRHADCPCGGGQGRAAPEGFSLDARVAAIQALSVGGAAAPPWPELARCVHPGRKVSKLNELATAMGVVV